MSLTVTHFFVWITPNTATGDLVICLCLQVDLCSFILKPKHITWATITAYEKETLYSKHLCIFSVGIGCILAAHNSGMD